jgi:hypothetical protein
VAKLFNQLVEGAEVSEAGDDLAAKVLALLVCDCFLFAKNKVKLSAGNYVFTTDFDVQLHD